MSLEQSLSGAVLCVSVFVTSYFILSLDNRHPNPSYARVSLTLAGTLCGYLLTGLVLLALGSIGRFILLPIAFLR